MLRRRSVFFTSPRLRGEVEAQGFEDVGFG